MRFKPVLCFIFLSMLAGSPYAAAQQSRNVFDDFGIEDTEPNTPNLESKIIRVKSISPQEVITLVANLHPEVKEDDVRIVASESLKAIIVRGPKKAVNKILPLIDQIQELAEQTPRQQPTSFSNTQPVKPAPVQSVQRIKSILGPPGIPPTTALNPLAHQLQSAETTLQQQRLRELARKYRSLSGSEASEADEEAEQIEQQLRDLVQQIHDTRQRRQQTQLDQMEERLHHLKERMKERESSRDAAIDNTVKELLSESSKRSAAAERSLLQSTSPNRTASSSISSTAESPSYRLTQLQNERKHVQELVRKGYRPKSDLAKLTAQLNAVTDQLEMKQLELLRQTQIRAVEAEQAALETQKAMAEEKRLARLAAENAVSKTELDRAQMETRKVRLDQKRVLLELEAAREKLQLLQAQVKRQSSDEHSQDVEDKASSPKPAAAR